MRFFITLYHSLRILSVDVVCGAVCSTLFASLILKSSLHRVSLATLAGAVWIIYIADHLLDSVKIKTNLTGLSARRIFFIRHRKSITIGLLLAILFESALLFFLPPVFFQAGVILMSAVVVYLFFAYLFVIPKEIVVALLYSAGVWFVPTLSSPQISMMSVAAFLLFTLLALFNLLIFSYIDQKEDEEEGLNSLMQKIPAKLQLAILTTTGYVAMILSILLTIFAETIQKDIFYMFVILSWMHLRMIVRLDVFRKNDLYRIWGESAFIIPILPYLLRKWMFML